MTGVLAGCLEQGGCTHMHHGTPPLHGHLSVLRWREPVWEGGGALVEPKQAGCLPFLQVPSCYYARITVI